MKTITVKNGKNIYFPLRHYIRITINTLKNTVLRTADTVEIIKEGSEKPVTMSLGGIKASELTDICTIRFSVIVQKFCCC